MANSREILDLAPPAADLKLPYGPEARQFGELRLPPGGPHHPVAIVIHGGFWRNKYNLAYMGHVCESLRERGIATWNLEFRSIGDAGGGWPGTCQDVVAGARHLRTIANTHHLDLTRTVAVGHSAGGHLALWLAANGGPKLRGVVGLGAVADLQRALELKLSDTVVEQFLNGGKIAEADPMRRLPLHTHLRLFHGKADDIVPIGIAERFTEAARAAGDDAKLIALEGGHFELVDPRTAQWLTVRDEIARMATSSSSSAV